MAGNYSTTARNALRYLLGTSKVADVDEGFQRLAEDVDTKMASFWEDTFAKRPAAGQPNRFFKASDTGLLYHDTGTVWEPVLGPGASSYGTPTARVQATEYEPSATRPVQVALRIRVGGSTEEGPKLLVGGVQIASFGNAAGSSVWQSYTFLCPAGVKWKIEGAPIELSSSYLTL